MDKLIPDRHQIDSDITSNGQTINVMTFGKSDPLTSALALIEQKNKAEESQDTKNSKIT